MTTRVVSCTGSFALFVKIHPCSHFHQHFRDAPLSIFLCQKIQTQTVSTEKLLKTLSWKNLFVKCWWNRSLSAKKIFTSFSFQKSYLNHVFTVKLPHPFSACVFSNVVCFKSIYMYIDFCGQYHQHFMRVFFICAFLPKSFHQSQNVTRKKLPKALLYEKCARKMLMTLTPVVNFINIFAQLFCRYPFDNKLWSQNVTREKLREALLYEKCALKMLMKLTPGSSNVSISKMRCKKYIVALL